MCSSFCLSEKQGISCDVTVLIELYSSEFDNWESLPIDCTPYNDVHTKAPLAWLLQIDLVIFVPCLGCQTNPFQLFGFPSSLTLEHLDIYCHCCGKSRRFLVELRKRDCEPLQQQ